MNFLISLLLFGAINMDSNIESNQQIVEQTPIIKERLFITMERTPCFGKCPNYKIQIFNTGRVVYQGIQFVDKEGFYEAQLSKEQMDEIKTQMDVINIFGMKDKYDSNVTDIPACLIVINDGEQKKKIYDRYNGPKELRDFEKLIDHFVLNSKLTKVNKSK